VLGKANDDVKAWIDIVDMCHLSELNLKHDVHERTPKSNVSFTLLMDKIKGVCEWAQELTIPDAY